jgi:hypothetical protein
VHPHLGARGVQEPFKGDALATQEIDVVVGENTTFAHLAGIIQTQLAAIDAKYDTDHLHNPDELLIRASLAPG